MNNKGVDCVQCSHYAVCRYKDNMAELREFITKLKHDNKNRNLDVTIDCHYYTAATEVSNVSGVLDNAVVAIKA